MADDPSRFKSENLPKYQWATFFSELEESFKGQPANIMTGSDFLHSEPPLDSSPLASIEYDSKHRGTFKHKGYLVFKTEGETATVDVPTIVWVYRDLDGPVIGIEVIDEKNNRIVVRFG